MFGLGFQEMLLITVLVIVFIPPDDLPKLMRTLGRYYAKIRRASDDLRRAFNAEVAKVEAEERRSDLERRRASARKPRPDDDPDLVAADPRLPPDAAPRRLRPSAPDVERTSTAPAPSPEALPPEAPPAAPPPASAEPEPKEPR